MKPSSFAPLLTAALLPASLSAAPEHGGEAAAGTDSTAQSPVKLVPTDVIPGNQIPEGTKMTLFADHETDGIVNPAALSFGRNGALYLAETPRFGRGVLDNRGHLFWLLEDIASQTVEDRRAMYERWADRVPPESLTKYSELVRRFEDTDGDGRADRVTTFADGFDDAVDGTAGGIFVYDDVVYFACVPAIYALEDTDEDGVADKREVLADGFGVRVSFSGHDLNGFALGDDGRLYGTIGDRGFSVTTKEGRKYHYPNQGAIFRFEPDGSDFEVIHLGLRNPKEIAFDDFGNAITVDNNSDQGDQARLVYIMEGADSGWRMGHQTIFSFREQIGLDKTPINSWMAERMWEPRNDEQPHYMVPPLANITDGPSGLTYYPGTGFLGHQQGRFLISDFRGNQSTSGIWSFAISEEGAGMKLDDIYKLNWGVTVTDIEYGYDGRLYVLDFITGWGDYLQGKIYSLTAEASENGGLTPDVADLIREGVAKRPAEELVGLLSHPDRRIRQRAHIALAALDGSTPLLEKATVNDQLLPRLHALWGLGIRARKGDTAATEVLVALVKDEHPEVRAQAAKVLGEAAGAEAATLIPLLQDPSLRVRAFAALSLHRLDSAEAFEPLLAMIAENDNQDLYLRHAAVMGLAASADAEKLVALSSHETSAVRLAAVLALRRQESPELARFLADPDPEVADEAIRAIHDLGLDDALPAVAALLENYLPGGTGRELSPILLRRVIHVAFRLGGEENAQNLVALAANEELDLAARLEILRLLRQWTEPHPADQSLGRLDPVPARPADSIRPMLENGIRPLLDGDPALLVPALALASEYDLGPNAVPTDRLREVIVDPEISGGARAAALSLWLEREPADADQVLVSLADDPADEVASAVLAALAERNPEKAAEALAQALKSPVAARRQAAWLIVATVPGDAAADLVVQGLKDLQSSDPDREAQVELLEAAAKRSEPAVKEALAAYHASLDPADPLAQWTPALEGGDPKTGKDLFLNYGPSQCMRCHRVGASDENVILAGPNLAGIAKDHDRRYLLEALMQPGAHVAPGFGIVTLTLKSGKVLGGVLLDETDDHYDITVGEDTWRVQKSDVASATEPVSAMPPMTGLLSLRQTRDIVAYLDTLDQPLENAPGPPEAKPYDPSAN